MCHVLSGQLKLTALISTLIAAVGLESGFRKSGASGKWDGNNGKSLCLFPHKYKNAFQ